MIVTEIIPYGKTKSKVLTDEDFAFSVYRTETARLGLAEGAEISEEKLLKVLVPMLTKRAMEKLLFLLKGKDYTEAELRRKLREACFPEVCADAAILWAKQKHYIDDRRYAENYIAWHAEGKSRKKLLSDLQLKGIGRELAEEFLDAAQPDEEAQILSELRKKKYDPADGDPKAKQRIIAYLARKGYGWGQIDSALRKYGEGGDGV